MRKSVMLILFILITIAISGCLSQPQTGKPPTDLSKPKENSEAGVTITALYHDNNAFDISLDTHSGSLDYDMAKISYVRDSKGNIIKPEAWEGGIGGHHLKGTLKFPKFNDNESFELVIQDVAGVKERKLEW